MRSWESNKNPPVLPLLRLVSVGSFWGCASRVSRSLRSTYSVTSLARALAIKPAMTNPKHAPNEIMPSDKMMLLNMTLAPHCDRGEPLLEALKPQVFAR